MLCSCVIICITLRSTHLRIIMSELKCCAAGHAQATTQSPPPRAESKLYWGDKGTVLQAARESAESLKNVIPGLLSCDNDDCMVNNHETAKNVSSMIYSLWCLDDSDACFIGFNKCIVKMSKVVAGIFARQDWYGIQLLEGVLKLDVRPMFLDLMKRAEQASGLNADVHGIVYQYTGLDTRVQVLIGNLPYCGPLADRQNAMRIIAEALNQASWAVSVLTTPVFCELVCE